MRKEIQYKNIATILWVTEHSDYFAWHKSTFPSTYKYLHTHIHPIQSNKTWIRRRHLQAGILRGSYLA